MKKLYLLLLLTVSVFVGCGREPIPEPVPEPPITPTDTTGTTPSSVESFAAAFVASGTYHDNDPAVLASTPLYCTIGSKEEEWRINNLQSLTNHIQQNGGEVMFDILPDLNHPQTCEQSFTAERIGWVFGHERR